jgi:phenylpropionate dioxygenase-like ring-hydroxylating dioxygenase large terminal subunit
MMKTLGSAEMKMLKVPEAVNHAPGRSYQEVLDLDTTHDIPAALRYQSPVDLGTAPIGADRYWKPEFFQEEVEKVFLRTWQFAIHEDAIPNPGDTHVFNLLHKSLLITRQADGSIKAMQNVCLHRGRKLATEGGCKKQFRCPFHAMEWNIDGSFKLNPFAWDFPQIDENEFRLPEARVEVWAGFVFVNFDPDAPSLMSLIGVTAEHFEHWRLKDCHIGFHAAKLVPANWKVVIEAFMEAHHVFATHPQANPFVACEQGQYDLITDHVSRFMSATGVPGELFDGDRDEGRRLKAMLAGGSRANMPNTKDAQAKLDPGQTARSYMAERNRKALTAQTGYDLTKACDADMLDGFSYEVFPNFHIWGGFPQKICYRVTPIGPETTLWEVMMVRLSPKDSPKPPPAQMRLLSDDEPWSTVMNELGYLSVLFDQDMAHMKPQQEGLKALGDGVVQFARYSEVTCRNLHRMIDRYIAN